MPLTIRMLPLVLAGLGFSSGTQAEDLLQLYRHTLTNNPTLLGHEQHILRLEAQADAGASRLRPTVSANGSYFWNDNDTDGAPSEDYTSTRAALQARMPLLDMASSRRVNAAKLRTEQTREERDAVRMDITLELVQRYLEALVAVDELAAVEAEMQAVSGQLNRLRYMQERQMAKITDVYETEAYLATLQAHSLAVSNTRAVAMERLRELSGLPVKNIAGIRQELLPYQAGTLEQWVSAGLKENPSLSALQKAMAAEEASLASVRAEYWPRLALQASHTMADSGFDNRRSPDYDITSVGLQLDVPLYEGGRVQANVREAQARYEIARLQLEGKRRELEQEIKAAYLSTVANHARIAATLQALKAQERSRDAQVRAHELGVSTMVDVLDAQDKVSKARNEHARARQDFIVSLVALRLQSGYLSEQDIESINKWLDAPMTATKGV